MSLRREMKAAAAAAMLTLSMTGANAANTYSSDDNGPSKNDIEMYNLRIGPYADVPKDMSFADYKNDLEMFEKRIGIYADVPKGMSRSDWKLKHEMAERGIGEFDRGNHRTATPHRDNRKEPTKAGKVVRTAATTAAIIGALSNSR